MLPSIVYTALAVVLALFFGAVGVLLLVRAGRSARARGFVRTAGILLCVYAVWSAVMHVFALSFPPVVGIPGEDTPEPTPLHAFYLHILNPVWLYANTLLVTAAVVLLVIALIRSRTPGASPAGPSGPSGQPQQYRAPFPPNQGWQAAPGPQGPPGPQGRQGPPPPQYPAQQPPPAQPPTEPPTGPPQPPGNPGNY